MKKGAIMERVAGLVLIISCLLFNSCKKDDSPVSNALPESKVIALNQYSMVLDNDYYKEWSNGGWEKHGTDFTSDGVFYYTLVNNSGSEYYYSSKGYSGFKSPNSERIMFQNPMGSLPDTVLTNQIYSRTIWFRYQGYYYSISYEYCFLDTVTLSIPLGVYNSCLHSRITTTLASGTESIQNKSYSWESKNLGVIKSADSSGNYIVLTKCVIGGKKYPLGKLANQIPSDFILGGDLSKILNTIRH